MRRRTILAIGAAAALGAAALLPSTAVAQPLPTMIGSTVIAEVQPLGLTVTAVAVEYSAALPAADIPTSSISVTAALTGSDAATTTTGPRTVVRAYANDSASRAPAGTNAPGRWMIVELAPLDANASGTYSSGNTQLYDLDGAYTTVVAAGSTGAGTSVNDAVLRPVVDDYTAHRWSGAGLPLRYQLFTPKALAADASVAIVYPLVVALHGAGEVGDNNLSQIVANELSTSFSRPDAQAKNAAFVVSPQLEENQVWSDPRALQSLLGIITELTKSNPIDTDRIYLTGLSLGSMGTWNMLGAAHERFAGAVTVAAGLVATPDPAFKNFPLWNLQSKDDGTVPYATSMAASAVLQLQGVKVTHGEWAGNLPIAAAATKARALWEQAKRSGSSTLFTAFTAGTTGTPEKATPAHFSWIPTYSNPVVHEWLFAQRRGVPVSASVLPALR